MTDTEFETSALELANLSFDGLSPGQMREQMDTRLAGLSDDDADMVVQRAAAIAREQAAAKMEEADAFEARLPPLPPDVMRLLGRRNG